MKSTGEKMTKRKKKINIIQNTPDDMLDDTSFQQQIIQHVNAFGFCHVIDNVVEAYRTQARRFNKQADELEKKIQIREIEK